MIGRLEGVLREKSPTAVLVDVSGVGYELSVPLSTFAELPDEGKVVSLRVHTHVREDALQLYGFCTSREREVFELLLGASRVGPRLALTVLSGIEAAELLDALRGGDLTLLQRVPGIGRRMAERLVVELRDKAELLAASAPARRPGGAAQAAPQEPGLEQILSALANLGVPRASAERAARAALEAHGSDEPIETLIRAALRELAR
jgi:Holliday junction DNA helicase RuvA